MKQIIIEYLKEWYITVQDDPLKGITNIFTLFLTIIGIAQAIEWIVKSEYPLFFSILFFFAILIIVIVHLKRPSGLKLFSIKRNENLIILDQEFFLEIDSDGHSSFTKKRKSILMEDPQKNDFRDNIHSSYNEDFYKIKYSSPDSKVIDFQKESEDSYSIYFDPYEEIKKLEIWDHEFTWKPSHIFGGRYDCIRLPVVNRLGNHTTKVRTEKQIEKVICFWEPPWLSVKNYDKLALFALHTLSTKAPPAINITSNSFEWSIECPKLGAVYNCLFFYIGGEQSLLKDYSKRLWITKLKILLHKIF